MTRIALTLLALASSTALAAQRTAPPLPAPVDAKVAALRDAALKDDVAYDIVEGLTTEVGQRLAATEAEARARTWGVAKLKALGFKNVHVETYQMPVWLRGEERAEVVAPFPKTLKLVALGNSGATPAAGLTAPVVVFRTYGDLANAPAGAVRGKIVYVGNAMVPTQDGSSYGAYGPARFVGPALAARLGAAAIVIKSIGTDHHRNPHTGVTDFPAGVAPIPSAALSVSDAELLERIADRGKPITLKLVLTPRFAGTGTSGNVIAEVPGSDPKAGIVLVGGHLDSWDLGTGAIDDASGVAITTAAAKRLLDGPRPKRTIRVVWFGAEEPGGYGGKDYARVHGGERRGHFHGGGGSGSSRLARETTGGERSESERWRGRTGDRRRVGRSTAEGGGDKHTRQKDYLPGGERWSQRWQAGWLEGRGHEAGGGEEGKVQSEVQSEVQ